MKFLMLAVCAAMLPGVDGAERLVARNDYEVSADWQPPKIMGKEWWPLMGFYQLPDNPAKVTKKNVIRSASFARTWLELGFPIKPEVKAKYEELGIELKPQLLHAFQNTAWLAYSGIGVGSKRNSEKKRTFSVHVNPLPEFDMAVRKNIPFMISSESLFRGSIGKLLFVTGEDYSISAKDKTAFEKWRKEHPNFLGFMPLTEWDNNAYILDYFYKRSWWPAAVQAKRVRADQKDEYWQKFRERWPEVKTRREWVEKRLRPYYQRAVDASFGDPSLVIPLAGSVNINHLAAYWGSKFIMMETSRHNIRWQGQMMFARGAARQFNIPWAWYVAGFLSGYTKAGKKSVDSSPGVYPGGISISAIRRGYFMTWLSGASMMESEIPLWTAWHQVLKGKPFELTGAGKAYVELYDFIQKHPERGVPYTPVALLVNYDRGSNRMGGSAFWKFPYTHADSMLDAFYACILDWPYNAVLGNGRNGREYVMANNPYCDIFDVITPDFEDQTTFRRILPSYKVAVLLGEYPENPELAKILTDYVRNGGTLLINVKHLNRRFPAEFSGIELNGKTVSSYDFTVEQVKLKNAEVIEKDNAGYPILTLSHFGKGRVLTALQHYMTNPKSLETKFQKRLPLIDKLLRRFSAETLPVKVEGDIQSGLNKTKNGWLLYLINNKGIRKFSDAPGEVIEPLETRTVQVSFPGVKVKRVAELLSDEMLIPADGTVTLDVKPGEIKILEIR